MYYTYEEAKQLLKDIHIEQFQNLLNLFENNKTERNAVYLIGYITALYEINKVDVKMLHAIYSLTEGLI